MAPDRTAEQHDDTRLGSISARLLDIADRVASESEAATTVVRGVADHAVRIAALASALEDAAAAAEEDFRRQSRALRAAREALAVNQPTIEALRGSVEGVASISNDIARIARESRMLSLNARIEAARSGGDRGAFAAISIHMSALTDGTAAANAAIAERSSALARDVEAANEVATAHGALVEEQDALLAAALDGAGRHRRIASELAGITAETAATVHEAASAIGRVGANAVAVKVLARQVAKDAFC